MRWLVLALLVACDDEPSVATPQTSTASPPQVAMPEPQPPTEPPDPTEVSFLSASGLRIHRSLVADASIVELARQDRPTTIAPILQAGAGDEDGPRVYWIAFQTSRFDELRGWAADDDRLRAFDADILRKVVECEANEDLGDCEGCQSTCFRTVPAETASMEDEIVLVRVSASRGGALRLDASEIIWRGGENENGELRIRDVEDLDGDGRLELVLAVDVGADRPSLGGHSEVRHIVVDADTLKVQFDIRSSRRQGGPAGTAFEESHLSLQDSNGDGRADYAVRYARRVGVEEPLFNREDDEPAEEAGDHEERHAHYSIADDEWTLADGETWPWLTNQ